MMEPDARKRILVIEDDTTLASSLRRLLEHEGFDVDTEPTGGVALNRATEQRPDLVILDLRLPDMHGYQVCQELRKRCWPWVIPTLMLTGMNRPIDQLRGYAFGADAYLTKPCPTDELLRTVKLLVGQVASFE